MSEKRYFNSKDAQLLINNYGFSIFPVHGIIDGKCTCGDKDCTNQGKHPALGKGGLHQASDDIEKVKELWDGRKGLNVGIATGLPSGVFVVDIDGPEGEAAIASLGPLPETLTARTGKGRHLFFKHPGTPIKTRRGVIGNKVDVRGDGGYVVGPGSHHISGNVYSWVDQMVEIAEAPQVLLDAVMKEAQPTVKKLDLIEYSPTVKRLNGWSQEDAAELLSYINPDIGYDEWVQIGMAIQSEGLPFSLWDEWSSRGSKYNAHEMAGKWKSFTAGKGRSFGTVVKMAQDAGWRRKVEFKPIQARAEPQATEAANDTGEIITELKDGLIPYTWAYDITPRIDANDFVEGLLGQGQFSVVYGESNCGKTFYMTDIAFHVAMGKKWRDRRVDQGGVVYVALEGSYGLSNRIAAFMQEYKEESRGMPFAVITTQINFLDPDRNLGNFIETVKHIAAEVGNVRLVVVDTLARAISGGDENSGQDMGLLVHHADQIRAATGAHVCFVHHSGKNKALGARGHSSLRAAVDTELEVSRDEGADFSTVKVVKQRDMEIGEDMYFGLKQVTVGVNRYNEEVKSCVVTVIEEPTQSTSKDARLTDMQQFVYDCILNALVVSGTDRSIPDMGRVKCITYEMLRAEMERMGFKEMVDESKAKNITTNTRISLRSKGKIGFNSGWIWAISKD